MSRSEGDRQLDLLERLVVLVKDGDNSDALVILGRLLEQRRAEVEQRRAEVVRLVGTSAGAPISSASSVVPWAEAK